MLNNNYSAEKAIATKFIQEHNYDFNLLSMIDYLIKNKPIMTYSERWGYIYDWMQKFYPEASGTLITGFARMIEG